MLAGLLYLLLDSNLEGLVHLLLEGCFTSNLEGLVYREENLEWEKLDETLTISLERVADSKGKWQIGNPCKKVTAIVTELENTKHFQSLPKVRYEVTTQF